MTLSGVDASTFKRVIDWMYANDYQVPSPDMMCGNRTGKPHKPPTDLVSLWSSCSPFTPYVSDADRDRGPWGGPLGSGSGRDSWGVPNVPPSVQTLGNTFTLHEHYYINSVGRSYSASANNKDPSENFTKVFLAYAKVYVFADQWCMEGLKFYALTNLHIESRNYNLWSHHTGEMVALLAHVYEHTSSGSEDAPEPMRKMVMMYAGLHMEMMLDDNAFLVLLAGNQDLMKDHAKTVKWRLTGVM